MKNILESIIFGLIFLVRRLPYQIKIVRGVLRPFVMMSKFFHKDLEIEVNDFFMSLNIRDSLFQRGLAFFPEQVDKVMLSYLSTNLKDGDVFVDAGAHAGYYSMVASRRLENSGRVIAIEADPFNAAYIQKNFDLNKCCSSTKLITGAVAKCKETLQLGINTKNRGSNIIEGYAFDLDNFIEVPANSIKGWLDDLNCERVDAIKLDIEGCEMLALESLMKDFPGDCHPRFILIEINPRFVGSDLIKPFLKSYGYLEDKRDGDNYAFIKN